MPETPNLFPARVVAHHGFDICVIDAHQNIHHCLMRRSLKEKVLVGDHVIVELLETSDAIIKKIEPRKNTLTRLLSSNKVLKLASNIDQILIIIAPIPQCPRTLIDTIMVAAYQQRVKPILVFNKSDLSGYQDWQLLQDYRHQNARWETQKISAQYGNGVQQLKQKLINKWSLCIGLSGVGKSTLINQILGKTVAKTQNISEHAKLGKHTTSASIAHSIDIDKSNQPSEITTSMLIDTPGIRSFNLADYHNMDLGFPDFSDYFGKCQFSNCQHLKEKNCSLIQAVEKHKISPERLKTYRYLLASAKNHPIIHGKIKHIHRSTDQLD